MGDKCLICGELIEEPYSDKLPNPISVCTTARVAAGFGLYDLCWPCWDGITDQYEAWIGGLANFG